MSFHPEKPFLKSLIFGVLPGTSELTGRFNAIEATKE
ncbi:hypothetical protein MNBD_GAMMA14-1906 [hydrothermal vent metagenome]|uniref:Uncharacterized protein n=1 Tax=hydrothermal vent metagenome TaxID=652676 RepID=A0A3B0YKJ2_9ZZZZ